MKPSVLSLALVALPTIWIVPTQLEARNAPKISEVLKLASQCDSGKQKACSELVGIVLGNWDENVRKTALSALKDQRTLASIAISAADRDLFVCIAAVGKVADQSFLSQIALKANHRDIRYAAVAKLTDQALLERIAMEDRDDFVRSAAIKRLTNPVLLARIAAENHDFFGHRAAVENANLTNQRVLARIAVEEKDFAPRWPPSRSLVNRARCLQWRSKESGTNSAGRRSRSLPTRVC